MPSGVVLQIRYRLHGYVITTHKQLCVPLYFIIMYVRTYTHTIIIGYGYIHIINYNYKDVQEMMCIIMKLLSVSLVTVCELNTEIRY